MVKSRATVNEPSLATVQPGMSSLIISTSARSITAGLPSTCSVICPSWSSVLISFCDMAVTAALTAFINLPNFLPITRKLHFTFFSSMLASTKHNSLTLTSSRIKRFTLSRSSRSCASVTGTEMRCSGWRTITCSFLRNERTIEVILCASSMRRSKSLSMKLSSAQGNFAKCTLSAAPATPLVKSPYRRSA